MLFCPRYRDSFGSSSSTALSVHRSEDIESINCQSLCYSLVAESIKVIEGSGSKSICLYRRMLQPPSLVRKMRVPTVLRLLTA